MHTAVSWLSLGKFLKRVVLLCRELATFLQDKEHKNARYFHDLHFLARLALLTDVFKHVNKLNTEFQEKAKWVFDFQSSIKAFVSKMQILREAKTNNYSHFCYFREFNATIDVDFHEELDLEEAKKRFAGLLGKSDKQYECTIQRFDSRIFRFAQFPFTADTKHCGLLHLR